jgi:hypothetical protein
MSNPLLILDAEGVSFAPTSADDRVGPDFPPSWEEFIVARRRFLDQLARSTPGSRAAPERATPLHPGG